MARHPTLDPDKRERLLRAAVCLIGEKGAERFSVEEIARRAGVAKGTVYLYFENREALVQAAFDRCFSIRFARSMRGVEEEATYAGKLKRRIANILASIREDPEVAAVLGQFYRPVNQVGTEGRPISASYAVNREWIRLGREAGEFSDLPLELLCKLFFSAVEGVCNYANEEPRMGVDEAFTARAVEQVVRILC